MGQIVWVLWVGVPWADGRCGGLVPKKGLKVLGLGTRRAA